MGINGLLPVLKSITTTKHVSSYRGQTAAVDAYCWLHRGAYTCARELCQGIQTLRHVDYCMQRVRLLQAHGVTPYIVFDGGKLPIKGVEDSGRDRGRADMLQKAEAHLRAGNSTAAHECFQKAVDITPTIAKYFIEVLKAEGIQYIVAPYEADAQMAFLALNNIADVVITEDSDLLAYGCPKVFFKMDKSGEGQEVQLADLSRCREISLAGFTQTMFLEMCIMAGCDFLKAITGIGIKKAHNVIKRMRSFDKACRSLRFSGITVPRGYEEGFQRAFWTFRHQRVFNPVDGCMQHLTKLGDDGLSTQSAALQPSRCLPEHDTIAALDFLGPLHHDELSRKIAIGELDPIALTDFEWTRVTQSGSRTAAAPREPLLLSNGRKQTGGNKHDAPVQNPITSYFGSHCKPSGQQDAQSIPSSKPDAARPSLTSFLGKAYCAGPWALPNQTAICSSATMDDGGCGIQYAKPPKASVTEEREGKLSLTCSNLANASQPRGIFWERFTPSVAGSQPSSPVCSSGNDNPTLSVPSELMPLTVPPLTNEEADSIQCSTDSGPTYDHSHLPDNDEESSADHRPLGGVGNRFSRHGVLNCSAVQAMEREVQEAQQPYCQTLMSDVADRQLQHQRQKSFVYDIPCKIMSGGAPMTNDEAQLDDAVSGYDSEGVEYAMTPSQKRGRLGDDMLDDDMNMKRPPMAELQANGMTGSSKRSRFFHGKKARLAASGDKDGDNSKEMASNEAPEQGQGTSHDHFDSLAHLGTCRKLASSVMNRVQGLDKFRFRGRSSVAGAQKVSRQSMNLKRPFIPPRHDSSTAHQAASSLVDPKLPKSAESVRQRTASPLQAFLFNRNASSTEMGN